MGDFNGRVGSRKRDMTIKNFGKTTINDNEERLIEFCQNNNIKITNSFYKHKEIHKYTWTQPTQQLRSIINYILVSQRVDFKIRDVRGVDCKSDHHLVMEKLSFPRLHERNLGKTGKKEEQFDLEDIDDPL